MSNNWKNEKLFHSVAKHCSMAVKKKRELARLFDKIKAHRSKIILILIVLLTAFLTCYRIWEAGYGNEYYTATVKSMLTSGHNFFFVSFDKGGFISVDKPALGLWLQGLFALVFGVHGWSVILPEALCSIGSVIVVYHIAKRSFGEACGLLAAFILALTPIFVAVSRTNNLDASLVFVCLLAVWALLAATEKGSLKLLVLSMALIGVGFNIKMMQAFMFLPAIYLVYFFTAETKIGKRVAHLAIATVILAAVSLSWSLAVDLTPEDQRPYVGSSTSNSTLELALGYNGILRVLPIHSDVLADISGAINEVPNEGAQPGLLRLFNREMAGQISWMLPMAVFGFAALFMNLFQKKTKVKKPVLRQLLLWGGIFVPMVAYFSLSAHIHRYYLIMLAPCLAVLSAVAVIEFAARFKTGESTGKNSWQRILLPLAIITTAAVQLYLLKTHYNRYADDISTILIVCTAAAVLLFVLAAVLKRKQILLLGLAVGILGLSAAPAYWAWSPIRFGINVITPYGGPPLVSAPTDNGELAIISDKWQREWFKGGDLSGFLIPQETVDYMLAHDNGSRYLVAVPNVMFAVSLILENNASVMALGGFVGTDEAIGVEAFNRLVQRGDLQYYFTMDFMESTPVSNWVKLHGKKIDPAEYSKMPQMMSYISLYDLTGLSAE